MRDGQMNDDKKNAVLSMNLISISIFVFAETQRRVHYDMAQSFAADAETRQQSGWNF